MIFKRNNYIFAVLMILAFVALLYFVLTHSNNKKQNEYYKLGKVTFNKLSQKDINTINNYLDRNTISEFTYKSQNKIFQKIVSRTNLNKKDLSLIKKEYFKSIIPFTNHEKIKLENIIIDIHNTNIFQKQLVKILSDIHLSDIEWNILKVKDIEFNFPCTIGKHILIPEDLLFQDDTSIKEVLLHEQMHILQRKNEKLFFNYYNQVYGKYIRKKPCDIINYINIDTMFITNPDSNKTEWIIFEPSNKKYYLVPYLYDGTSGVITDRAYEYDIRTNTIKNNYIKKANLEYHRFVMNLVNNKGHVNLTHPHETFTDIFLLNI